MTQVTERKKPRFDWYETDEYIVLSILIKQIIKEKVSIRFEPRRLIFNYHHSSTTEQCNQTFSDYFELVLNLNGEIVPSESRWTVSAIKAEIKMRKADAHRWGNLEMANNSSQIMNSLDHQRVKSLEEKTQDKIRSWDQLVKEVEKEDEEQGGVEELFRRIYATGDENLRRAMNKSFVESNGTVLSTNWDDVGKSKVEMKPPDNCEYKKWDE